MLPQYEHLYRQLSDRFIAPYMRDFLYNALRQVLAFDFDLQTFISRDFLTSRRWTRSVAHWRPLSCLLWSFILCEWKVVLFIRAHFTKQQSAVCFAVELAPRSVTDQHRLTSIPCAQDRPWCHLAWSDEDTNPSCSLMMCPSSSVQDRDVSLARSSRISIHYDRLVCRTFFSWIKTGSSQFLF